MNGLVRVIREPIPTGGRPVTNCKKECKLLIIPDYTQIQLLVL